MFSYYVCYYHIRVTVSFNISVLKYILPFIIIIRMISVTILRQKYDSHTFRRQKYDSHTFRPEIFTDGGTEFLLSFALSYQRWWLSHIDWTKKKYVGTLQRRSQLLLSCTISCTVAWIITISLQPSSLIINILWLAWRNCLLTSWWLSIWQRYDDDNNIQD